MKLLLRFFGWIFAVGTVGFLVGVAGAAGLFWHYSKDLPDYSQLQDYEPPVMTRAHAGAGGVPRCLRGPRPSAGFPCRSRLSRSWCSAPSSRPRTRTSTTMAGST